MAFGPDDLLQAARHAALGAYARYSRFRVGAAVLADGRLHTGCNVEIASYGLTICAERVAVFRAVADGARTIEAVAVACIDADPAADPGSLTPCGACRQVMAEFAAADMLVHIDRMGSFRLLDLLPNAFVLRQASM